MALRIAWELGRTEAEVLSMDPDEFARWVAFFKMQKEEADKAARRRSP